VVGDDDTGDDPTPAKAPRDEAADAIDVQRDRKALRKETMMTTVVRAVRDQRETTVKLMTMVEGGWNGGWLR
jgi:hypothetical protein